jgi:hypothetical protein
MSCRRTLLAFALVGLTTTDSPAQEVKTIPADAIRQALDQNLKLDYAGAQLDEVVTQLEAKTKIRFHLDTLAIGNLGLPPEQPFTFRGEGKVRQLLQRMLAPYNLTYVQLEDTLVITTEEQGFHRQLRQRVPLDVRKQSLDKALADLARATGVNLVVDPRVAKEAQTPVSLQLDDATVETSVRLLAEIGGLKAVCVGNVLFVTSEERAVRIRKEEMHPLAPHMNGVTLPAVGAGLIRGFGGVQALPAAVAPPAAPANPAAPAPEPKEP